MDYKKYIASKIKAEGVSEEEIYSSIALPPNTEMGDYALPCFRFAKVMRKSPALIAQAIAAEYPADGKQGCPRPRDDRRGTQKKTPSTALQTKEAERPSA